MWSWHDSRIVTTFRRLLLVSANRERFPEPVFPIGPAYVAAAAREAGAEVSIFDAGLHRKPLDRLREEIARFRPDLVGMSFRNLDNAGYPFTPFFLPLYQEMVGVVRGATGSPVVVGGPAFSMFPDSIVAEVGADLGFVGDGEAGIAALLRGEIEPGSPSSPRVVERLLPDLSSVRFPADIDRIFPAFRRYRTIGVQTSRGCPHRCLYCSYTTIEGRSTRPRPAARVVDDLELLAKRFGKRELFVVDSSFNADERQMVAVLEEIVRRNLGLRFACYVEPKVSDPALFDLLARAGCVGVEFGTDTGSPTTIRSLRKGFSADDVLRASVACRKAGIDACHSLIFGAPGETRETIRETVRLIRECRPFAVLPMIGLRIYPGTGLAEQVRAEGIVGPEESFLHPRFYFAGWDPDELVRTVREEVGNAPNWFFPAEKEWMASIGYRIATTINRKRPMWRNLPGEELPWFLRWIMSRPKTSATPS
jgi:radical SAM superfamily enzyme YgiQ (UPF0313 family)